MSRLPSLLVTNRAVHSYDVLYSRDFLFVPRDLQVRGDLQLGGDLLCRGAAAGQLLHLVLQLRDALGDAVSGEPGLRVVVPALHDGGTDHRDAL